MAYVEAMWLALQHKKAQDYIISSGKSISIRDITLYVLKKFGVSPDRIKIDPKLFRSPNVEDMYGDKSHTEKELGWKYNTNFFTVIDELIEYENQNEK